MIVRISYFSGTGSTEYVAHSFRREIEEKGHSVILTPIGKDTSGDGDEEDLLLLIYAVYACNPPHPVVEWLRSHKSVNRIPAAVISVSGGGEVTPNLACRVWAKRLLHRRGYSVFFEKMLVMPSNWIVSTKPVLVDSLLDVLPGKISSSVNSLLNGETCLKYPGPGNRLLSLVARLEHAGAPFFGRNIRVSDSCSGCGRCAGKCPVGNIAITEGRPVFGKKCALCLNCLYICPQKALSPGWGKAFLIPEGYDFNELLQKKSKPGDFDLIGETKGILWLGLRRYLRNSS